MRCGNFVQVGTIATEFGCPLFAGRHRPGGCRCYRHEDGEIDHRAVAGARAIGRYTGGDNMMTVTFGLLAVSAFFLWRRKAEWGWAAVLDRAHPRHRHLHGRRRFLGQAGGAAMRDEHPVAGRRPRAQPARHAGDDGRAARRLCLSVLLSRTALHAVPVAARRHGGGGVRRGHERDAGAEPAPLRRLPGVGAVRARHLDPADAAAHQSVLRQQDRAADARPRPATRPSASRSWACISMSGAW